MEKKGIYILPIDDHISQEILTHIQNSIFVTFNSYCKILKANNLSKRVPEIIYEGKYNSTAVLMYISQNPSFLTEKKAKHKQNSKLQNIKESRPQNPNDQNTNHISKLLAVTNRDLYSPIFSTLYGEAQFSGFSALMSLHRLSQEFYRLPPDPQLFLSRCEKEALHEMGHTLGLMHCKNKYCLMYPSSKITDTDIKSNTFCPTCSQLLKN